MFNPNDYFKVRTLLTPVCITCYNNAIFWPMIQACANICQLWKRLFNFFFKDFLLFECPYNTKLCCLGIFEYILYYVVFIAIPSQRPLGQNGHCTPKNPNSPTVIWIMLANWAPTFQQIV